MRIQLQSKTRAISEIITQSLTKTLPFSSYKKYIMNAHILKKTKQSRHILGKVNCSKE